MCYNGVVDKRLIISHLGVISAGLLLVISMTGNALALLPGEQPGPGGPGSGGGTGGAQPAPGRVDVSNIAKTETAITNVAKGLATVLFALAAIFIIISGIFYLTAAGNQTQLDNAKNTLIYAIVGVVLGLIAFGVAGL